MLIKNLVLIYIVLNGYHDSEIGELDKVWNWLAIEYEENPDAKIVHYTLGTPCFDEFYDTSMASYWKKYFKQLLQGIGKKIKL